MSSIHFTFNRSNSYLSYVLSCVYIFASNCKRNFSDKDNNNVKSNFP